MWKWLIPLFVGVAVQAADKPNIVLILADDLGYGDVSALVTDGKLKTPHLDALAAQSLVFTDAHTTSATCTPSRYALLTGEYPWRKKGTGVLPGDAALVIEPGRDTLPSALKKAGWRTGIVGKWHLGLGSGTIDWNGEISPGPNEIGFDHSFIMAATGDRVPCVYVENRRVVGLDPADPIVVDYKKRLPGVPTGKDNPELLRMKPSHGHDMSIVDGVSRIGWMKGGTAALWRDTEMSDRFRDEALKFIEASKGGPFFLYFALHEPHVPRIPHPRFVGKSGMGPRGDAILQLDDAVGRVMATLDALELASNTLVIFTSDNGPVVDDGYQDQAVELLGGHKPGGPWRGGKYSAFEAATRVPFMVRWPGRIKPGTSSALVSQVDLLTSLSALTGTPAPTRDGENVLPALLGESGTARRQLVEHNATLSLRDGPWKYIAPSKGPAKYDATNTETGLSQDEQLYDVGSDPGETKNLATEHPDRVAAMKAALAKVRGEAAK